MNKNTYAKVNERDTEELLAACKDAVQYFEAILEISAFVGERSAVESKIVRLKSAIAKAEGHL